MGITISKDDGLIPLKIDDVEVMVDPFELEEAIGKILSKKNDDGSSRNNSEAVADFNVYLETLKLPKVNVRGFATICIRVQEVIEEIKKKDGWATSTSTTPNSSDSTTA